MPGMPGGMPGGMMGGAPGMPGGDMGMPGMPGGMPGGMMGGAPGMPGGMPGMPGGMPGGMMGGPPGMLGGMPGMPINQGPAPGLSNQSPAPAVVIQGPAPAPQNNAVSLHSASGEQTRTALNDIYTGTDSNDVLRVTAGVAGGTDKFIGGNGFDTLIFSGANTNIGAVGVERIITSSAQDSLAIQTLGGQTTYVTASGGPDIMQFHSELGGGSNTGSIRVIFADTSALVSGTIIDGFNILTDRLFFGDQNGGGTGFGGGNIATGSKTNASAATVRVGSDVTQGADADDRWVFNTSNNTLYYDVDGSGASASTSVAIFSSRTPVPLTSTNIAEAIAYVDSADVAAFVNPATASPTAPGGWT